MTHNARQIGEVAERKRSLKRGNFANLPVVRSREGRKAAKHPLWPE